MLDMMYVANMFNSKQVFCLHAKLDWYSLMTHVLKQVKLHCNHVQHTNLCDRWTKVDTLYRL